MEERYAELRPLLLSSLDSWPASLPSSSFKIARLAPSIHRMVLEDGCEIPITQERWDRIKTTAMKEAEYLHARACCYIANAFAEESDLEFPKPLPTLWELLNPREDVDWSDYSEFDSAISLVKRAGTILRCTRWWERMPGDAALRHLDACPEWVPQESTPIPCWSFAFHHGDSNAVFAVLEAIGLPRDTRVETVQELGDTFICTCSNWNQDDSVSFYEIVSP